MTFLSLAASIAATLTLTAAVFHGLVYFRRRAHRADFAFAATCLFVFFYDVFSACMYSASSPETAYPWFRARMLSLCPIGISFIWYLALYTRHPARKALYAFTVYFMAALVIGLWDPRGLVWGGAAPFTRHVPLPFGLEVVYHEMALRPHMYLRYLIRVALLAYFAWVVVWFLRQADVRKAVFMTIAFSLFFAGLANDAAIRMGLYNGVYLFGFAFLAVMLFMTLDAVEEIVTAAIIKDRLEESEKRHRLLAENVSDNVFTIGLDFRITYTSPSVFSLRGYTPEEVIGQHVLDQLPPSSQERAAQALDSALAEARDHPQRRVKRRLFIQQHHKDGHIVDTEIEASFLYGQDNLPVGVVGVCRDVTAQKMAEKALRDSEEKYRRIFESLQDVYYEAELDGAILEVSPSVKNFSAYTREELIGRNLMDFAADPEGRAGRLAEMERTGMLVDCELPFRDKDGTIIRTSITAAYLRDSQGKPTGSVGTLRNIEARKKAEEALKISENRFRLLAENSTDVIWTMTLGGRFTYVSPAVERITGFTVDEVLAIPMEQYVTPDSARMISARLYEELTLPPEQRSPYATMEAQQYAKDGSIIDIEITASWMLDETGQPVGVQGATRDIRERKQAEREKADLEGQLLQARKMEAIGTLAGGIAHDFNNILYPIIGYTEMSLDEAPHGSTVWKNLRETLTAATRAKELVSQILTFGRRDAEKQMLIQALPIVDSVLSLIRATVPTTISMERVVEGAAGYIRADPSQIHQVIMNLCTNAYQAMRLTGGVLRVTVGQAEIAAGDFPPSSPLEPGPCLRIAVEDTGQGIAPDVLGRIFEPYFTTKGVGEGSGMGLAVVHAIVAKHGGEIRVASQEGKGSSFEVLLPLSDEIPETVQEIPEKPAQGGSERILLVDDEDQILRMTTRMLEGMGYAVTPCADGRDALDAFRRQPRAFDLVITDMAMPGMTGDQLAQGLMEIRASVPIILCTGFSEQISEPLARELGIAGYLLKPLKRDQLGRAIRQVLDAGKDEHEVRPCNSGAAGSTL